MPTYINGLVIPDGFRAVAFKRGDRDMWFVEEDILQIRYTRPQANWIFTNILSGSPSLPGSGVYDPDYPTEEGYFWIKERTTQVNDITFTSYSLKDRLGIVSIRLSSKYSFDPNYAGPKALAFANEDYILVVMLHDASTTDFINALLSPFLPPTTWTGHVPTPLSVPLYTITTGPSAAAFTTALYIPEWRGETRTISDVQYIETRDYYHYYVDFADYLNVLVDRMSELLRIPVKHKSEYLSLQQHHPAFIVYTIDYQDKNETALYRHLGPWATHQWVSAKVLFEFHASDFLIYRGFLIDFNWFVRITNQIPSVRVFGPGTGPNTHQGYYASIKWGVPDVDWSVQEDIEEVNSSKGYYNYQYDFSAELYYFWIRPRKRPINVEQILAIFTEPRPMDCETIRNVVTNITWLDTGSVIIPDPSQLTPLNHMYI